MQIVFQDPFGALSPRLSVAEIITEGLDVLANPPPLLERREIALLDGKPRSADVLAAEDNLVEHIRHRFAQTTQPA